MSPLTDLKSDFEPDQQGQQPRSPPRPVAETYKPRQAAKIAAAIDALWPNGIPRWLSVGRRDWEIANWIWEQGEPIPCERTIRRYFERNKP